VDILTSNCAKTHRLVSVTCQTSIMKKCAIRCNDFVAIDGTHDTNECGLASVPPTVVCALGRSVISGNSTVETESSESTNNALHGLSLIAPASAAEEDHLEDKEEEQQVLMTDGNPSFPIVAETNGMIFLNCADHHTKTGNKSEVISGMAKEQTDSFWKGHNKLVFDDFSNEDKLVEFVSSMKKQCKNMLVQRHF